MCGTPPQEGLAIVRLKVLRVDRLFCVHEILMPQWPGPTSELRRPLLWEAGVVIGDAIKQLINGNHDKCHV